MPHSINPESLVSASVVGWSLAKSGSLDWPSGSVLTSLGASTTTVSTISDPSAALSGTDSSSTTGFFRRLGGM